MVLFMEAHRFIEDTMNNEERAAFEAWLDEQNEQARAKEKEHDEFF